jgi:hypothetical protein
LDAVVGQNTRLILRTDAVPFRVLVDGPPSAAVLGQTSQMPTPRKQLEQTPSALGGPAPGEAASSDQKSPEQARSPALQGLAR